MGLTPQQHQALLAVEGFPGRKEISISELAERLQLEHHSVVGLVNRLEKEELLMRQSATEDRRFVMLRVSEKGKTLLGQVTSAHKQHLEQAGPELIRALKEFSEKHPTESVQIRDTPQLAG